MKLFHKAIIVVGVVSVYLGEVHDIKWIVTTGDRALDLTIGGSLAIPMLIAALVLIAKILGFGKGKEDDQGWYYDEEDYEEEYQEEEEEVYQQPVKITWWNDWYDE